MHVYMYGWIYYAFVDENVCLKKSAVMISYKMQVDELKTMKDYREMLVKSMFRIALNRRLFRISRRKDPPYFSCSIASYVLVRDLKAYIMSSSCKEKGTLEALESMLIEVCHYSPSTFWFCLILSFCFLHCLFWCIVLQVARVRLHGFSEREISVVRDLLMSSIESAYLERDQMESTSLRYEYSQVWPIQSPMRFFNLFNLNQNEQHMES